MKIIIDARTTQDEVKLNGLGRYSRFIIQHLIENFPDTQFKLIMYNSPSTIDEAIKNRSNVEVVRLGEYNDKGFVNMVKHNLNLFFHIGLNKALKQVDLSNSVFLSLYFWRGLPVFKIPTVSVIHDFALVVFNIYSTISPLHNFLRFIHYWIELLRVYFAKHIIVDASYTLKDIKKYLPFINLKMTSVVPLGVHQDIESEGFEELLPKDWKKKGYFIYLGAGLTENKNSKGVVDSYLEFVNKLKANGVSPVNFPYLVIAGKNFTDKFAHQANKFREYVVKIGINDFVHYTGLYEDSLRWDLMRNSIAFIHLSLYEGFGFAVAEAMRCKVPVIAHKGSTYEEVVKDGGMLVNGKKSSEVADAMMKIWKDKEFSNRIAQRGYEISKEYDWDLTAKNTFKVLEKVYNEYYK